MCEVVTDGVERDGYVFLHRVDRDAQRLSNLFVRQTLPPAQLEHFPLAGRQRAEGFVDDSLQFGDGNGL